MFGVTTVITLRRCRLDLDNLRKVAMNSATTSLVGLSTVIPCCGYKIEHFGKSIAEK